MRVEGQSSGQREGMSIASEECREESVSNEGEWKCRIYMRCFASLAVLCAVGQRAFFEGIARSRTTAGSRYSA